jgi:hypothetical protein
MVVFRYKSKAPRTSNEMVVSPLSKKYPSEFVFRLHINPPKMSSVALCPQKQLFPLFPPLPRLYLWIPGIQEKKASQGYQ